MLLESNLNIDDFLFQNTEVSVFEVNIRFVGGLLSAYYLSGKEVSVSYLVTLILCPHFCNYHMTGDDQWSP